MADFSEGEDRPRKPKTRLTIQQKFQIISDVRTGRPVPNDDSLINQVESLGHYLRLWQTHNLT